MATYVPNALTATEPTESRTVESAALEFRTLKTSITDRVAAAQAAAEAVQADVDAETADRIAADAVLQASIDLLEATDTTFADKLEQFEAAFSVLGATSTYTSTYRYIVGVTPGTSVGQTLFIGLELVPDNTEVFYNGVLLYPDADYTLTTTTITLAAPANLSDTLVIYVYRSVVTLVEGGVY